MQKRMIFLVAPLALIMAFYAGTLTQSKSMAVSGAEQEIGASTSHSKQPLAANAAKDPVTEASYLNGTKWIISEVAPLLVNGIEKGRVFTLEDIERRTHILTVYPRHQNYSSFSSLRQGNHIEIRMAEVNPPEPSSGDPYPLDRSDYIRPLPR